MRENICKKNTFNGKKTNLNETKIDGLEIHPKNQLKYEVEVNSVVVVNQKYIEKLLQKKTKRKLDYCLRYIISLINSEEGEENPGHLQLALDDLAHYKSIIEYKYRKYLDEKYTNLLLQKIDMLEHEIKVKLAYLNLYQEEKQEYRGKSR